MDELYISILLTHVSCAIMSLTFFVVRGFWMLTDSSKLQISIVRILPHIVDTVLLASALLLTVILERYPFLNSWLTAKLFALVIYIILGTIALKRGRTKRIKIIAFISSIVVFTYIVLVAISHNPAAITTFLA